MFENYVHNNRTHDYFETGKMYLALEDYAIAKLSQNCWRQKKAEVLDIKPQAENNVQPVQQHSSWMSGFSL